MSSLLKTWCSKQSFFFSLKFFFILFSLNNSVLRMCTGCVQLLIWEQALAICHAHRLAGPSVCVYLRVTIEAIIVSEILSLSLSHSCTYDHTAMMQASLSNQRLP
jgi:hypothetical protein